MDVADRSEPSGPHAVLVHGAGLDAESFAQVGELLAAVGWRPVAVTRRGYDGRAPTADLGVHVDDLLGVVDRLDPGAVVLAGVSGGATLALGVALRGHRRLRGVVAHEPLLGPAAADQHEIVTSSIETMLADPSPGSVAAFCERLVTSAGWRALDQDLRERALGHERTIRIEAVGFAAFAVDPDELGSTTTPLTWTVGTRSPQWRHSSSALAASAGIDVRFLDAAHTPQLEDPAGFVRAITEIGAVNS